MDYKKVKNQYSASKRMKIAWAAIIVLICIIALQCIIAFSLWVTSGRYKVMYEEALGEKLELQDEINRLQEEQSASHTETIELPFVTGGETEN